MPEERRLFKRARVIDALRYLGRLKGLEAKAAERRAEEMLMRVDLADSARYRRGPLAWGEYPAGRVRPNSRSSSPELSKTWPAVASVGLTALLHLAGQLGHLL